MPRKVIKDVVEQPSDDAKSSRLSERETPSFLKRKQEFVETYAQSNSRSGSKLLWWGVGIAVVAIVIVAFFIISNKIAAATLSITPRHELRDISTTLSASKNGVSPLLAFDTVKTEDVASTTAVATGEKLVERKASGKILIFNEYEASPMKLVTGTRFQSPNGNIYRTQTTVTIPGKHTEGGKVVPGSTEATVIADKPGISYNLGLVDFVLPAYKGKPQYTKVYARSKTPMEGGFAGKIAVISDTDKQKIAAQFSTTLKSQLEGKLASQIPAGFIVLPGTAVFTLGTVDEPTADSGGSGSVVVSARGTLEAIVLSKDELAKALARATVDNYAGDSIAIDDLSTLTFSLPTKQTNPTAAETLQIGVTGKASFTWLFDQTKLIQDLVGIKRDLYKDVLVQFPGISQADPSFTPPWLSNFPKDPSRIHIEIKGGTSSPKAN